MNRTINGSIIFTPAWDEGLSAGETMFTAALVNAACDRFFAVRGIRRDIGFRAQTAGEINRNRALRRKRS